MTRYVPRHYCGNGLWRPGDWRLKTYAIHADPAAVPDPRVDTATKAHVTSLFDRSLSGEATDRLGFVITHHGHAATWLLFCWWVRGDSIAEILSRAERASPDRFTVQDSGMIGCVWELAVVEHERRAWVDTMLTARPDPDAYLARWLANGTY